MSCYGRSDSHSAEVERSRPPGTFVNTGTPGRPSLEAGSAVAMGEKPAKRTISSGFDGAALAFSVERGRDGGITERGVLFG